MFGEMPAATDGVSLYVGPSRKKANGEETFTRDLLRFDLATREWSILATLPEFPHWTYIYTSAMFADADGLWYWHERCLYRWSRADGALDSRGSPAALMWGTTWHGHHFAMLNTVASDLGESEEFGTWVPPDSVAWKNAPPCSTP